MGRLVNQLTNTQGYATPQTPNVIRGVLPQPQAPTGGGRLTNQLRATNVLPAQPTTTQISTQTPINESPLSTGQRAALSFSDPEGAKAYIRTLGYEPVQDTQGNLLIKKGDRVYRADEQGFSFGDIADALGKALPFAGQLVGGVLGAGSGLLTGGATSVPGAIVGGAAGGGLGETAREAIGGALGVRRGVEGGELAKETAFGAVGGLVPGIGGKVAEALAPRIGTKLAESAGGQLLEKGALRAAPGLGARLAGSAVATGTQGGIIQGGEKLIETGSPTEAAKGFATGFATGAPFGPLFELGGLGAGRVGEAATQKVEQLAQRPTGTIGRIARVINQNLISPVRSIFEGYGPTGKKLADISDNQITRNETLIGQSQIPLKQLDNVVKGASEQQINNAAKILTENKLLGDRGALTADELIAKFPGLDEPTQNIIKATYETTKITSEPLANLEARYVSRFKTKGEPAEVRTAERANPFLPAFSREPQQGTALESRIKYLIENDKRFSLDKFTNESEQRGAALAEAQKQFESGVGPTRVGRIVENRTPVGFENLKLDTIDQSLPTNANEYTGLIARNAVNQADRASKLESYIEAVGGPEKLSADDLKVLQEDGPDALIKRIQNSLINETVGGLAKGDTRLAKDARDFITKQLAIINNISSGGDLVGAIKKIQATKLSLSFLPNAFQSLNTLLSSDFPTLAKGFYRTFASTLGQESAIKAGARAGSILESEAGITAGETGGKVSEVLNKAMKIFLRPFKWTEEGLNRSVAGNTGMIWAEKLAANKKYDLLKGLLKPQTLENLVKTGRTELTEDELIFAANKFIRKTQFGSNPLDIPGWFNTPWGSVIFQFKNFAYRQLNFLLNETAGELKAGRPGRAAKNLATVLIMFPAAGAALNGFKDFLNGKEPDETDRSAMQTYLANIASVGGTGIAGDLIRSLDSQKFLEFLAGPSLTEFSQVAETLPRFKEFFGGEPSIPLEAIGRLTAQRFGGAGSVIRNRFFSE